MITSVTRPHYIAAANKNSEVKKYLRRTLNFFGGIRDLLPVIHNSKSKYCQLN